MATDPAIVCLRPGDRVLLALREEPTPEQGQEWIAALSQDFPGVTFTLVGGTAGLAILPGKEPA